MEQIPKKLFYKIGEVCEICEIQPHVLRYWETEFSQLSPSKNSSGQRVYRYRDLQLVQRIKQLLYQEGFTIAGANRKLSSEGFGGSVSNPAARLNAGRNQKNGVVANGALPFQTETGIDAGQTEEFEHHTRNSGKSEQLLDRIRFELQEILEILRDK